MKKTVTIFSALLFICLLCSCSRSARETYFVHSIGFETDRDGVAVTALLEKHGKDSDEYFTARKSASSVNSAAEKIMSEYKDCYFATCDLYFISLSAASDTISEIAKEICDSNIFPTTGEILCVNDGSIQNFMRDIKKADQIKKIKKDTENRTNIVSFFAEFSSDKSVTLDTFSLTNGEIQKNGRTIFVKDRKAVFHEERER